MTKPELSVWTSYYIDLSPEDAVLELKKHGIMAAELSDEHGEMLLKRGDPISVGQSFRAFLEQENFTMTQGHLWLKIRLCTDEDAYEKLCGWLDLYHAIGIRNGVLHVDRCADEPDLTWEERADKNIEILKRVDAYLEHWKQCTNSTLVGALPSITEVVPKSGCRHCRLEDQEFRICLENIGGITPSIELLNTFIDRLGERHFGICLDTGHLNLAEDKDQSRFILMAGKRLHALHIADNEGKQDQHMMPYGRGQVNFEAVVRALRQVEYDGLFNLEIPGERHAPLPIRGYKLEYIKKCYDYLMNLT